MSPSAGRVALVLFTAVLAGCGGTPKAADLLDSATSYSALAGEVVAERAKHALARPFARDALGAAAKGLDDIATQLESASGLDAPRRQAAARESRDRAADARRLATGHELPAAETARFIESSCHFHALADSARNAAKRESGGGSS